MKIFLSVGRTFTDAQENYVCRLEDHLRLHGMVPQTVGRSYFSSRAPLKAVEILMNECVGTVVVALERTYIPEAIDRRGSPKAHTLAQLCLPTVWNQIEAAIAYARGHPLLVMREHTLKPEGLLEEGYDWYVLKADVSHMPFTDRESVGVFADWKARVEEFAARSTQSREAGQSMQNSSVVAPQQLSELRKQISTALNDEELATLCFDLGVDYENLKGSGKEAKARELVIHCRNVGKLGELTELCRAIRPNLIWG